DELEVMVKCPELALREVQSLTDKQKAIADARISRHAVCRVWCLMCSRKPTLRGWRKPSVCCSTVWG
ncbi:hypothetical protein, partial [Escherichia coli]|uniref:hypothetical protein n=1 Tax=Escherichia coli TaxID=562 RepID=UPI001F353F86